MIRKSIACGRYLLCKYNKVSIKCKRCYESRPEKISPMRQVAYKYIFKFSSHVTIGTINLYIYICKMYNIYIKYTQSKSRQVEIEGLLEYLEAET